MIDPFVQKKLDDIAQMAQSIKDAINFIYGYCAGVESVANDFPGQNENNAPTAQINGITTIAEDLL